MQVLFERERKSNIMNIGEIGKIWDVHTSCYHLMVPLVAMQKKPLAASFVG